jgi:predicted amidohydrolase YtcJ
MMWCFGAALVIDPESGLDAVRDVAIVGDRVAAVGVGLPPGRRETDVAGQVVTAGFVDLHSHAHDLGSARLQVADGVTTALELEAGITPVATAYAAAAVTGRPLNYGFDASWTMARMAVLSGVAHRVHPGRARGRCRGDRPHGRGPDADVHRLRAYRRARRQRGQG